MKAKHLVTVEISEFLAKCGVAKIVEAMIKRNVLRGEAISAWIEPHPTNPRLRVFKFFADDTLHRELLLRRNGPLGEDQGWNIMLWVGSQHSKAHISQPLSLITTTAVAEADQLKADRERARVAEETDTLLALAKATTTTNPIASTSASTSPNINANNNAKPGPTVKAKIDAYLEEKKLRAAALAAEEEAAEAERLMDETDNADITLTSSWADGDPPSPPSPPPAS
jgi:hypothetical protein